MEPSLVPRYRTMISLLARYWILAKGLGMSSKQGHSAGVSLVKGTAAKKMLTHWGASLGSDNWLSRSLGRSISQRKDGTL